MSYKNNGDNYIVLQKSLAKLNTLSDLKLGRHKSCSEDNKYTSHLAKSKDAGTTRSSVSWTCEVCDLPEVNDVPTKPNYNHIQA